MPKEVDHNIGIFYRQETTPENLKTTDRAGQATRSDLSKDNPHYEGDNARDLIYNTPPYQKFNRLSGYVSFDQNNPIWKYTDEDIMSSMKKKLAAKYKVKENDMIVRINRSTLTIHYQYLYYINSKIQAEEGDVNLEKGEVRLSGLEREDKFQLKKMTFDTLKTSYPKAFEQATIEDTWVKWDATTFKNLDRKVIVKQTGKEEMLEISLKEKTVKDAFDFENGIVRLVERGQVHEKKKQKFGLEDEEEEDKSKLKDYAFTDKALKGKPYIIFTVMSPELVAQLATEQNKIRNQFDKAEAEKVKADPKYVKQTYKFVDIKRAVFRKLGPKLAELAFLWDKSGEYIKFEGKVQVQPTEKDRCVVKKEFEQKYRYETDDLENVLRSLYNSHKHYSDEQGSYAIMPFTDVDKAFKKYDVPIADFNVLTKQTKLKGKEKFFYTGAYKGPSNTWWWSYEQGGEMKLGKGHGGRGW